MAKKLSHTLLLFCLLAITAQAGWPNEARQDDRGYLLPAALVNELDQWLARADFWRFVIRAENIRSRIEVHEINSRAVEAWLCGTNTICMTTGLKQRLTEAEYEAALAHEIGHIVIPRNKNEHPQLRETQCDLLAVAVMRDADYVKDMLYTVNRACPNCRDEEHPAPYERIALLDYAADQTLEKIKRLDAFRKSNFALHLTEIATLAPRP
jgi:hypothetical protein